MPDSAKEIINLRVEKGILPRNEAIGNNGMLAVSAPTVYLDYSAILRSSSATSDMVFSDSGVSRPSSVSSGVSRIDFMIDMDNNNVYLNEINTIPGSLAFYLWEPLGMKYEHLLDNMIELALKADRENHKVVYSFETNVLEGVKLGGGSKGSKM